MKILLGLLLLCGVVSESLAQEWRQALPGWSYEFPRDHHAHTNFKTEWWYFTGRLVDEKNNAFGYQLTFFRQGLRTPGRATPATSRFVIDDLKFAHFAVSDVSGQKFHFGQKLSRGAFGEAGFGTDERLAWIENWSLRALGGDLFELKASDGTVALELQVQNTKPWAIHGMNGASQKADGVGRASHYYSGTRMTSKGTLTIGGKPRTVTGESWLDREWGSNQLAPEQAGWDWFSVQLDDGTELMLYQMRTRAGARDPNSSATWVARDGTTQHLTADEYTISPEKYWTSKQTGGRYPIGWRIQIPKLKLELVVSTKLEAQELNLQPISYWEGLIDVEGQREGRKVSGHGYLELTGYAGALVGLSEPQK